MRHYDQKKVEYYTIHFWIKPFKGFSSFDTSIGFKYYFSKLSNTKNTHASDQLIKFFFRVNILTLQFTDLLEY